MVDETKVPNCNERDCNFVFQEIDTLHLKEAGITQICRGCLYCSFCADVKELVFADAPEKS